MQTFFAVQAVSAEAVFSVDYNRLASTAILVSQVLLLWLTTERQACLEAGSVVPCWLMM